MAAVAIGVDEKTGEKAIASYHQPQPPTNAHQARGINQGEGFTGFWV
jgi:hypothetical protein